MKFSVKNLKPFVKVAVNNIKEEIISQLIAQLESAYQYADMTNEDNMYNILLEEPDTILNNQVDSDIVSDVMHLLKKNEIAEIVGYWQQEKIDMLIEDFDELPRTLRKLLQGFI